MKSRFKPKASTLIALGLAGLGLIATPAFGIVAIFSQSFIGNVPAGLYDDEPCFPETIDVIYDPFGVDEVRINVAGVESDGDPDTWIKCQDFGNETFICTAGFADGTIATCYDIRGPFNLPGPNDRVYMFIDPDDPNPPEHCDVVVERVVGEDHPGCRGGSTGSGGGGSTGGTGGTGGACNASTAQAVLTHSQSTTIPNNACVQLRIEPSWSTVNPSIQAQPGTAVYPVPFSYTSCRGNGSSSLTGDWSQVYLVDGNGPAANFGCDVFLKLNGDGSTVKFGYYD